jgi:hypothetical protein
MYIHRYNSCARRFPVTLTCNDVCYCMYEAHAVAVWRMHLLYADVCLASMLTGPTTTSATACMRLFETMHLFYLPHTSAYVSIRQHTSATACMRLCTSSICRIRQHTSAYVSIRLLLRVWDYAPPLSWQDRLTYASLLYVDGSRLTYASRLCWRMHLVSVDVCHVHVYPLFWR